MKPINLQLGWPSRALFPKRQLAEMAQQAFTYDEAIANEACIYGPDPGSDFVRKEYAIWLTECYRPTVGPINLDNLFLANGASAALGIIMDTFTDPTYTRRVWMIEPTYFMACPIFEDAGFQGKLRGVPEDSEGIDTHFLEKAIKQVDADAQKSELPGNQRIKSAARYPKLYRHVIYVVPTFSNPSGKVMSLRRRRELVQLARRYDALLIADDVYDLLRWPVHADLRHRSSTMQDLEAELAALGPPPPRLADIDRGMEGRSEFGNACSNGSFSKIVAPGVRTSWVEGTSAFTHRLSMHGSTRSGGCPAQASSIMLYFMLQSGTLQQYLKTVLVPTYQRRYHVMMDALTQHLVPLGVKITGGLPVTGAHHEYSEASRTDEIGIAGGFFCYIMFPEEYPSANEIAQIALKSYALKIAYGQMMIVTGDFDSIARCEETFGHGARLSWSWCNEDEIEEGIQRLALVLRDIRADTVQKPISAESLATLSFN